MKTNTWFKCCSWITLILLFIGCTLQRNILKINALNKLDIDRKAETITIPVSKIEQLIAKYGIDNIVIRDGASDSLFVIQQVDNNMDGKVDELLIQVNIQANGKKILVIEGLANGKLRQPVSHVTTYSRFVPERIDDYAWENDRVAFRAYGPKAQQNTERGFPDSTLSSGMDCWLKRVNYPVIDNWYKKNLQQIGYYHIDHGEGYDPYHVGPSRGCGGTGIMINKKLYVSKNYKTYKTIAKGPIRTIFELTYAPWDAAGNAIKETKRISLDLGSNLTRYEENIEGEKPVEACSIGITLHEKKGDVKRESREGWFRYWEPIDISEMGTGIVLDPALVAIDNDNMGNKDADQLLVLAKVKNSKLVFYAGFGWKKSGQFKSREEWDNYLRDFAKKLASPLVLEF